MRRRTAEQPRWKAFRDPFPALGEERTARQRRDDEKQLRLCIREAHRRRLVTGTAMDVFTWLIDSAEWGTGAQTWSNEQWCKVLGLKKPEGVQGRGANATPLKRAFRRLIELGLVQRVTFPAHDDGRLHRGTEAWRYGLTITMVRVWNRSTFWQAIDCGGQKIDGGAQNETRSGAQIGPRSGAQIGPRFLNPGIAVSLSSGSGSRSRSEPSSPSPRGAVSAQPTGLSSRRGGASAAARPATPPRAGLESVKASSGGAPAAAAPTLVAAGRLRPRDELERATAWFRYRQARLHGIHPEATLAPSRGELDPVLRAFDYCTEAQLEGDLQWVVWASYESHKSDADRDRRWSVRALLKPEVIAWGLDFARNRRKNVADPPPWPRPAPPVGSAPPGATSTESTGRDGPPDLSWAGPEQEDSIREAIQRAAGGDGRKVVRR